MSSVLREAVIRKVTETCRKVRKCPHCGSLNGPVKKLGALRIIHDKYKGAPKDVQIQKTQFENTFAYAVAVNADINRHLHRTIDNIDAQMALKLFQMISPQVVVS